MSQFVDLHMHTTCSDGLLSPAQLLEKVRGADLAAFSITDHDTIDGYRSVASFISESDSELITGVELSVSLDGNDIHMLAYLFDPDNADFNRALDSFRSQRGERGKQMVELLRKQGVDISYEEVESTADGAVVGRPHVAETMHRIGAIKSYEEAFKKYIGQNCPAYIPKTIVHPQEAIELIHRAGGVTIMAHPFVANMQSYLETMATMGLDGVEAYHYTHSSAQTLQMIDAANRYNMIYTGGSDFHGRTNRAAAIGSQRVPLDCLEQLKTRKALLS